MKRLIGFAIIMLTAFAGLSQTRRSDTVCMPIAEANAKLIQIETLKRDHVELLQKRAENEKLTYLSASKDITIQGLNQTVKIQATQIQNFSLQTENYQQQIIIRDKGIKDLEKSLRHQKTKTFFTGVGGILAAAGLTLLFTHTIK